MEDKGQTQVDRFDRLEFRIEKLEAQQRSLSTAFGAIAEVARLALVSVDQEMPKCCQQLISDLEVIDGKR